MKKSQLNAISYYYAKKEDERLTEELTKRGMLALWELRVSVDGLPKTKRGMLNMNAERVRSAAIQATRKADRMLRNYAIQGIDDDRRDRWERVRLDLCDLAGIDSGRFSTVRARLAERAKKSRSAWDRGVDAYALDILDTIEDRADLDGYPLTAGTFREYALNGAKDYQHPDDLRAAWGVASWGGSYLIYNEDIARRLCSPSEFAKTKNGERRPNAREEWLDTQARALFQAFNRLSKIF